MKGTRSGGPGGSLDLGSIFDEIFEAARDFHDEFRKNFTSQDGNFGDHRGDVGHGRHRDEDSHYENNPWIFNENTDYYPNYSYPPMNVFMTRDRSLIFEFALAGFDEKDISLSLQGDYMVFLAKIPGTGERASENDDYPQDENIRYFKRRLKMKDIEKQKYYVPMDKYAQDEVKALFRNGILRVSVPPKEEQDQNNGIKIEIVTESE